MKTLFVFGLLSFGIFACSESNQKNEKSISRKEKEATSPDYKHIGNQVTNTAQSTLLKHVGSAMKMGGPNAAIQYCNINALSITDSLSTANHVKISRVTERNRNEKNALVQEDLGIWEFYKSGEINVQMGDTLVNLSGKMVYYKPIYIANPACLNCHGQEGTDILEGTIAKLNEFYS
ncbi:MAG: DUF3365 domain-containing protein [Crocinitomicaceae bacterium]